MAAINPTDRAALGSELGAAFGKIKWALHAIDAGEGMVKNLRQLESFIATRLDQVVRDNLTGKSDQ